MKDKKKVKRSTSESKGSGKPDSFTSGYRPRVVVIFHDYVEIPYKDGVGKYLDKNDIGPWRKVSKDFPGIRISRLIKSLKPERMCSLVKQALKLDPDYKPANFLGFFAVDCPRGIDPEAVANELSSWQTVETAYVEGGPTSPPAVNPADDPHWPDQGYLDPAPDGIDVEYAWSFPGGDGGGNTLGLQFVDMEQGWTLNHEDLQAAGITTISGLNKAFYGHGTAVMGIVVAVDNAIGGIGIAPNVATKRVVSQWRNYATSTIYSTTDAIMSAIDVLNFGDVLLLEAQTDVFEMLWLPVEVEDAVFAPIRLATALGIVVVESAGNYNHDLDNFIHPLKDRMLNRTLGTGAFRDSGAIMVGAASSTHPHIKKLEGNFGSRIDCYAWGENIFTAGDGSTGNLTDTYIRGFGATSGAAAIIAGAALSLQGIAQANLGYRFSPYHMRRILSDHGGTPVFCNTADSRTCSSVSNPETDPIGVMPNLRRIIDEVMRLVPDVYLRDFVGDTGDPHTGAISASPDIILRPSQVLDPMAAFGHSSGTGNSNTLGFEAKDGQDNYIYVRMLNRGPDAASVKATVYWSPVATLVTPDLWKEVGSVVIPSVPSGGILTVSDAIVWPANEVPGPGHYCFVGLIGNVDDPAPILPDFSLPGYESSAWNYFCRLIRENNNVAWRNFNVVENAPSPPGAPADFVPLPFMAPGAPDKARRMRLEVMANLPRGSKVVLEMPLHLFDAMEGMGPVRFNKKRQVAILPVNLYGRLTVLNRIFPAKSRAGFRMLVKIPKKFRQYSYELYVRQMYREDEVGRVTWRLVPAR